MQAQVKAAVRAWAPRRSSGVRPLGAPFGVVTVAPVLALTTQLPCASIETGCHWFHVARRDS